MDIKLSFSGPEVVGAARRNMTTIVEAILSTNPPPEVVNYRDGNGLTPFHGAVMRKWLSYYSNMVRK